MREGESGKDVLCMYIFWGRGGSKGPFISDKSRLIHVWEREVSMPPLPPPLLKWTKNGVGGRGGASKKKVFFLSPPDVTFFPLPLLSAANYAGLEMEGASLLWIVFSKFVLLLDIKVIKPISCKNVSKLKRYIYSHFMSSGQI